MSRQLFCTETLDGMPVRMFGTPDDPWFALLDICKQIGLSNPSQAAATLSPDQKGLTSMDTPGGPQSVLIVSEAGMYSVVLRSREAGVAGTPAFRFKEWVTNEVLPSIRKTGKYSSSHEEQDASVTLAPQSEVPDLFPGDRLGKLVVVSEAEMYRHHRMVRVKCECGSEFTTRATHVRTGRTTMCTICRRKQKRLAAPKDNSFLLSTYQLAMADAQHSEKARYVMDWCHQQLRSGAGN